MAALARGTVRIAMALLSVFFAAGCGGYQSAVMTEAGTPSNTAEEIRFVRERSTVRVELRSGDVVKGEVSRVSEDSIVIGRVGNYGYEETVYSRSEIGKIEVYDPSFWSTVLVVVGVATLGATIGLIAFINNANFN